MTLEERAYLVESLGGEDKFYEQLRENKKRLNWKDDRGRGAVGRLSKKKKLLSSYDQIFSIVE